MLKDNNNEMADHARRRAHARSLPARSSDRVIRYWGRIDDQYGFKTGAGYVKPKLNERNLANAITEVLAGKRSQQTRGQGRRLLHRPRCQGRSRTAT